MPRVRIDDSLAMHYEDDDFTPPWYHAETVVLVHGIAENATVWYGWVPQLAQKFRILRIDLRGWGKSTIPLEGYPWSTANFAQDLKTFLDKLKLPKVHLVGAKTGGTISLQFAHDYPERLHSLTLIGSPVNWKYRPPKQNHAQMVREKGLEYWARTTMEDRLGEVPQEMIEGWIKLFVQNSPRVTAEILAYFRTVDLTPLLPEISVPTLVVIGESEALAPQNIFRKWQESIPNSKLVVIPSKAYHIAVAEPEKCTAALLDFLGKVSRDSS